MKNKITLLVISLLTCSFSLAAQLKPELENNWIKSNSLGPILDEKGIKWQFIANIKSNEIAEVEGFEVNGLNKIQRFKQQTELKPGNLIIVGPQLSEKDYDWLFESGSSSLFFSINIKDSKGVSKTLNIPLTFSAKSKDTLRTMVSSRFGIQKKIKEVPYSRNIDGRRWIIGNSGEDDQQVLVEMIPIGSTIQESNELYRINLLKKIGISQRKTILDNIKLGLSKNCPSLTFNILKENNQEVIYEWNHSGCNGFPASSEVSKFVSSNSRSTQFSFSYKLGVIPIELKQVYLAILMNER
ncbi:hypothetical protein [Leptospira alstonii]|uniref:hypothetical protein n=1 Tax=Leptospira alstonii TaxID=28452 RepID=UPI000773649E|nr:hypothetical protein [Leptospira alstonii]